MSLLPHFHRSGISPVSRIFDDFDSMLSNLNGTQRMHTPSFDVRETEKAYYLDGELPGVQQKDLSIEFEDEHCLKVIAHSERASTSDEGSWWVSERSVGDFRRTFNFPATVDAEHTQAHLKNGVLSLEIPKSTEAHTTKKVEITE